MIYFMTILWIIIFILSIFAMVRGGDMFLESAEKIGLSLGISPFIIGTTLVAVGTSFPELLAGIFAVLDNAPEMVLGNVIGSNVANILLVMGVAAVYGGYLAIKKDIVNLDLPLLAITTGLFLVIIWDGVITSPEAIVLLLGQVIYILYTLYHKDDPHDEVETSDKEPFSYGALLLFIIGALGLVIGARYTVTSVIALSQIFNIGVGVIPITAVAIGTSLPELWVSIQAARQGKAEIAFGNIFGSNVFNIFMVVGIPALIMPLHADPQTMAVGIPFLIIATLIFLFSALSRRIYIWEGLLYLLIYILFIGTLFGFF